MPLIIQSVSYANFRNLRKVEFEPSESFTIIHGPNAAGKTNCVEGISLLTNGASFRHLAGGSDMIGPDGEAARVRQRLVGEKRLIDEECVIAPSKKTFVINGKNRRASECPKILPSVLFNPDDLLVVKGPASGRRDLVDAIGVQLSDAYRKVLRDYTRAVTQRNSLLKGEVFDGDVFESWTNALVAAGSTLYLYRQALVRRLVPYVDDAYRQLSHDESIVVEYRPFCGVLTDDRQRVVEAFHDILRERRQEEVARRTTVAGPHHDDIAMTIDGRAVRNFGSQGQQRTTILAIKMANAALVKDMLGYYPVFLLDDVMSELDNDRRRALFSLIDTGMQTIVTTANLDYFTQGERDRAKVLSIVDLKARGGSAS